MQFTKLIPNIFYSDIKVALQLFVDTLGFAVAYSDDKGEQPFYIIKRDTLVIHLIECREWAVKDRPEIRLETDDIHAAFAAVNSSHPELLHPNAAEITLKPWGALEFALRDAEEVCVIVQQPA
ncbi:hypothetical protein [Chitinophaga nivalis]|uniref:Glyoxalase/bleomycin resistance/extradiol dioxygenase family protein n=1 Tax=Chitinophaga nivalis TaxID=2991709 RepID=A0ABT3IT70_9BACT|nr:hypothetical protein [Chitinophaga nivalis]MCW3463140.1 hypothetical protein [Chitinophaga nivalis]MCW3487170.1 hypothetical protein [Chitinophaga nivalis]